MELNYESIKLIEKHFDNRKVAFWGEVDIAFREKVEELI